jgi:hypothetical protein
MLYLHCNKDNKNMKNTYLIFPNPNDVYSNLSMVCTKEELNDELLDQELIEPFTHYTEYAWVVFENGKMIHG